MLPRESKVNKIKSLIIICFIAKYSQVRNSVIITFESHSVEFLYDLKRSKYLDIKTSAGIFTCIIFYQTTDLVSLNLDRLNVLFFSLTDIT